jgi:hypothetical protein
MIGIWEEVATAAVAGEEQGRRPRLRAHAGQHRFELARSRLRIADVQPHRLADPRDIGDGDRAGVGIGTEHTTNEEIAEAVLRAVLVDPRPSVGRSRAGLGERQILDDLLHASSRLSRELDHEIALGGSHHYLGLMGRAPCRRWRSRAPSSDADGSSSRSRRS